jgi:hypothetical protein
VYDLIPSSEILAAQKALENEMSPQIQELISRAESGLEQLKKRERELHARVRLLHIDHEDQADDGRDRADRSREGNSIRTLICPYERARKKKSNWQNVG